MDQEVTEITTFEQNLRSLINAYSLEGTSDTPDFILAQYLISCLAAYEAAIKRRDHWYGDRLPEPPEVTS